jgi:hypothetical protein
MVLILGLLLWLASRNPLRNVAIVDGSLPGLCILAVTSLLSLWMTDSRSIYPAYFLWGRSEASEDSFGGRAGRGPA